MLQESQVQIQSWVCRYLNLTSLKHSIPIKILIALPTVILPSFFYQIAGNLTLNLISSYSCYISRLYKYLLTLVSYWSIPWLLLLSLGTAEKLYIKIDYSTSRCTEDGMVNATETATCSSDFYWYSKRCLSCYLLHQVLTRKTYINLKRNQFTLY